MTRIVRSNVTTAVVFLVALVASWLVLARLAGADVDAGQMMPDAGVIDRVVAADHAAPVVAPPPVEPATVDEGISLGRWVWAQFRAGRVAPALIVLLHLLGLVAIRRWTWVARRLPRLTRGRALAAVSSLTGSLAALTPLVATDAALAGPLYGAIAAAVGVYLLPGPTQIAGETVPA